MSLLELCHHSYHEVKKSLGVFPSEPAGELYLHRIEEGAELTAVICYGRIPIPLEVLFNNGPSPAVLQSVRPILKPTQEPFEQLFIASPQPR